MSNNDNAMTRFLFAILRQKNLKDIDWNKVASDPILAQEITNGHAARMRYSRFRSAMLGLEPQRRNRPTQGKSRVTKSKKDIKPKREDNIKSETTSADSPSITDSTEPPTPKIKQETMQSSYDTRLTPGSLATPSPASMPNVIQPRLLTPCSDTDAFATSQGLAASPSSEMLNSQGSFDFPAPLCGHEHTAWQHSNMYSPFETPHEFDGFGMGYGHQHLHHHTPELFIPQPMSDAGGDQSIVKHEDWDARC